jgi:hypothetical protein
MKFSIDTIPSGFIFEFRDFGWILTVGHWAQFKNRDSRVFSSSPWNFWSIEHNHALFWKFGTDWGVGHWLGSRPQAQMTVDLRQKTLLVLRPFARALTCSILITGTQVMLRKAYFLRRGSWLRPKSRTPRPRIQNFGPYYWDAHTNGLIFKISAFQVLYRPRNRSQTDGLHNDFSRAHFL